MRTLSTLATIAATLAMSAGGLPAAHHAITARAPAAGAAAMHATVLGPVAMRFGRSVGTPTEGHLIGGMHLDETAYLRIVPADTAGDVRWGLQPLVEMIDRAARSVRRQYPGTMLSVGHLSREGGGEVDQHRSHESGRDADVGFFVKAANGRQLMPARFVPFRGDGTAPTWPGAYFDDAKNWALVAALISDPEARVTHLFVAAPLRARLLAYAERMEVPAELRMRAAELMQQPHGTLPHDDHFHVRIACPAHMASCVENPAPRPRPAALAARGRRGVVATPPPGTAARAAPSPGPIAPAPHHVPPAPPDLPAAAPAAAPPAADPSETPPASLPAQVDDVDG